MNEVNWYPVTKSSPGHNIKKRGVAALRFSYLLQSLLHSTKAKRQFACFIRVFWQILDFILKISYNLKRSFGTFNIN